MVDNSRESPQTCDWKLVRLGCPKPYNSRHLRLPERFQNSLPPSTAGGRLFFQNWFQRRPLRAGHGIPSSTGGISEVSSPGNFPLISRVFMVEW